jgi:sugar phosphate isomerase/epimerase
MALPRLALAVIGDEIGPSLEEMISFCAENDVRRLDMRTVEGRNLLGMPIEQVRTVKRALQRSGIETPCFVSPILKWPAPGRQSGAGKVDFAFDPGECPAADPFAHAFEIASVLGARHMRIFSYLRYDSYRPLDLKPEIDRLLALAERHDVTLEMENEPVCNVGSIPELAAFFAAWPRPLPAHLRPLVDISNSWSIGAEPGDADMRTLAPSVDLIHLKDRDFAAKRTVPLGDGGVPWNKELRRLLGGVKSTQVVASIETHCPHDGRRATAKSVAALRRIANEIGVELV